MRLRRASYRLFICLVSLLAPGALMAATPSITSLSLSSATIGQSITITGANFGSSQGTSTVTFNNVGGMPTSWSASSIVVPVPTGATTGNVVVTVAGAASNGASLTINLVTLPGVSQIQPASGATAVPENARIVVRFAQPVQQAAVVTGTVMVAQGQTNITGTLALSNDGLSVTFVPSQNLAANTTFSVAVTNVTNNQTTPEFQSSFVTGSSTNTTSPTLIQTNPQNNQTNVPISAAVALQFSKAMDPSTLTPSTFVVSDPISGTIPGMVQVDPTGTTASFVPSNYVSVGRNLRVQLLNSIEDSDGNRYSGSSFSFTTSFTADSAGPQLLGSSPYSGATNVPLNALFVLEFSKPVDAINIASELQVELNNQAVAGSVALSNGNQQLTFTPTGGLSANSTYTITTTSQITDIGGLQLTNPGSFTLTTGTTNDTTTPSVTSTSPLSSETAVPVNAVIQLRFSKAIDPWTVTAPTIQLTYDNVGPVGGTITTSPDGMSATFTPGTPIPADTSFHVQVTNGITDLEGHALNAYSLSATTGATTVTTGPTVSTVSPENGATGVPVNIRVDLLIGSQIDAASVNSSSLVVSTGGISVPGTVSLNSTGTTLTYIPSSPLAANTTYSVSASGFTDQAGNLVTTFTSSFITSTSNSNDTTSPAVVSITPANRATSVSVNSPIVLTFNEAVDATTLNPTSIKNYTNGTVLAGTYSVDSTSTIVTFTPLTQFPANAAITTSIGNGVLDLAGNASSSFYSSFTTGSGSDSTAPTVTMITPQNGATGIGPDVAVVITFSKSLNPNTINTTNFAMFANGSPLAPTIAISADNRTVTLTDFSVPLSSTITVLITSAVTDLSGNSLGMFQSQFTTAANPSAPSVVTQRPGNGATGVPLNSSLSLYMSEPMISSTLQSALEVSQNGVLVTGATQVLDNGQVVQFTPSGNWQPGAVVQVFLGSQAQSTSGLNLNNYQASFTIAPNPNTTAPTVVATNPVTQVTGVPTNVVIDFAFSEPINPTTLLPDTVACSENGVWFQTGLSVIDNGMLLQVAPRSALLPNTAITCLLSSGIEGVNGLPMPSSNPLTFTTGAGPDTTVPVVLATSPPNGAANVGDNGIVNLAFSKPMNPLTINSTTVQLSSGGENVGSGSISFSNSNQNALLVPTAPLPDGSQITLTASGLTDVAGNALAPQTTQFTTGVGPDVVPPLILSESPYANEQNVPINTAIFLQMSQPIDPSSVGTSTLNLENSSGQSLAGTYSVSTDGLTISFVPSSSLNANSTYSVNFPGAGVGTGISDLAGNSLQATSPVSFTTGSYSSTSAPQVVGVSPSNAMTGVPINAQVVIAFNEPIDAAKLSGITLSGVSNLSETLSNANERLTIVPSTPLPANTNFTLTIAGVQDVSGNVMSSPYTSTFSTGSTVDFSRAQIASESPTANSTGVSISTSVTVNFGKQIDPLTISTSTMELSPYNTAILVPGTVTATGTSATFTPSQPLDASTYYELSLTSGVKDLEGQSVYNGSFNYFFTTGQGSSGLSPNIVSVVQAAATVGTSVIISGTYFGPSQGTSTVTFNGVTASPTSWTDTRIAVPVPSGATSGPVVVTVNSVASNNFAFIVDATPTVSSVSPSSGPAGTILTIAGTNLGNSQDHVSVIFDQGNPVTATSANETTVTVAVPLAAPVGTYALTVDTNGYSGSGGSFTVVPTPSISQINPTFGVADTPVAVTGTNFGTSQGSSAVTFNGIPAASITYWSNTTITAVPPTNVTSGPVVVTVNSVPSPSSSMIYTVTNPAIGSITPPAAAPGAVVTIVGSGYIAQEGQSLEVLFNGVPATSVYCTAAYCSQENPPYSSIIAQVPSGATTGPVTVVIGGISSNAINFTVESQPTITSMSPSTGPMSSTGTVVPITISGSGFGATQSTSTVNFFGSNTAPTINDWSDTSISLNVPADAATGPLYIQVGGLNAFAPTIFTVNAVSQTTDSLGNASQYNISGQGGVWFTTSSQGTGCSSCSMRGNITQTPDAYGNVLSSTDDLGNTTTYTYDPNNNLASVSKPLNSTTTATTSYTYNSFGEVLTMTDPLGNVTTNTYDSHGNLLTVTAPKPNGNTSASVTQFQYATNGELSQITDPNGNVTKLAYNSVGLIASITDAQNNVTSYQYDSLGDRTAVIDPVNGANHPTTFAYDAMSRLTGITYPDGSAVGFTYDIRGRRITSTDQNEKTTTYTYDDADRLTAVTDPASNVTQYAYDTENNLLSITDANGHATQFAYNSRGWVTQTTFPSALTESYNYDLVGNMLSKTDRKGNTIQYVYDALYRLSSKTYPDQTSVEYAYDLAGKVLQVSDPTGSYGFAYDNMGRLIGSSTQYSFLAGTNYTTSYTYDSASNRTSLTAPDGAITTYGYDTLNRLHGLTNSWAGSFGFSYDPLGRRTQLTRPNGITTNYVYDSASHLLSILHQDGVNTLDGASYTYDEAGNRTSKTNYLNGAASNYGYDALYELTQVTQAGSTNESYSYDPAGNRLQSLGVPNYNYNVSNELTLNSNGSYTYDANGNTLSDAQGRSFTWDFENRLAQAVIPGSDGGTTSFRYDPFGKRIQKAGPLGTTNYLYDVLSVVEEVDNSSNVLADYSHGAIEDETLAMHRTGTTWYDLADGLGSITSLSSVAGNIADTYTYDSFGNLIASSGTAINPIQYIGREFDKETNLYFNRARYYDPNIGRFMSEDPVGFAGGMNFYGYSFNSPVNLRDPSGRSAVGLALPVSEGFGTVVCFGSGVCETAIVITGIVVGVAETGYLVYNWYENRGHSDPIPYPGPVNPGPCDKQPGQCKPCPPDSPYWEQPGNAHGSTSGVHYHWYTWNQKPYPDCTCYPSRMSGGMPPTGGNPWSPKGQPWP